MALSSSLNFVNKSLRGNAHSFRVLYEWVVCSRPTLPTKSDILLEFKWCPNRLIIPIGSMYGIFTYIWAIYGVNDGKYSIHGAYGIYIYIYISGYLVKESRDAKLPSSGRDTFTATHSCWYIMICSQSQASQSVAVTSCQGDIRWMLLHSLYLVHYQGLPPWFWHFGCFMEGEMGTEWVGCLAISVLPFWSYSSRPLRFAFGRPKQQSASEVRERTGQPGMIPGSKSETSWRIHYFPFLTKKNNFFDESQVPAEELVGGPVVLLKISWKGITNLWCCHECCTEMPQIWRKVALI